MPTMLRHSIQREQETYQFIQEQARCAGLLLTGIRPEGGGRFSARLRVPMTTGPEWCCVGTIPDLLREFDAYAEGCRRRGRR